MSVASVPGWAKLGTDEETVWTGRPSPYLVKYWIAVTAGVVLVGLGALWLLPASWEWVGWLVVVGALVVAAYAYFLYRSVVYVVTTRKIYRKTGLLRTDVDTVRLDRIQNVSFTQTFLQRLVGCGDMSIDTAGSSGTEIVFRSVPNPSHVNSLLVDQVPS